MDLLALPLSNRNYYAPHGEEKKDNIAHYPGQLDRSL